MFEFITLYKDQLIIGIVLIFVIISLYREWFRPAVVFLIAIVLLCISGILAPEDVLQGFSNEQIFVILLLLIIGDVIRRTEILNYFFDRVFKKAKTEKGFLVRMMFYVSSISAFFNNTPLVALLIPYVMNWGKKHNVAASKLLIPLSYATILGGSVTLIGTSTNLLVNGMVEESGRPSLNIFDFSIVGIPMVIIGVVYFLIYGRKALPANTDVLEDFVNKAREYLVETHVMSGSKLINKTVGQAGLRNLKGLYLVEIIRGSKTVSPVSPHEFIEEHDTLTFVGATKTIAEIINSNYGLALPQKIDMEGMSKINVIEAFIPVNSGLTGNRIKETNFRAKYDAAIMAVHRNGEKLTGKIGDIVLQPGDLMLLIVGPDFATRTEGINDYYIISKVKEVQNINFKKVWILLGGTALAILGAALKNIPILEPLHLSLFKNLLLLLAILLVTKIVSSTEVKKSVNVTLWVIASFALAMGVAMEKTGTAALLANQIINICKPLGIIGIMAGIYLITSLLAGYMSYLAAISIVFPIAMNMADSMGVNYVPFALLVAFGASANFFTPIGYQTNLMVLGPGKYNFRDFFRVGFPLSLIFLIVSVIILSLKYDLI